MRHTTTLAAIGALMLTANMAGAQSDAASALKVGSSRLTTDQRPVLDIASAIETTRVAGLSQGGVFPSPDGRAYVSILISGDVGRNIVKLRILHGRLDDLNSAAPREATTFTMSGLGGRARGDRDESYLTGIDLFDHVSPWIDNERIALLWADRNSVSQVFAVTVSSGRIEQLTFHPTDVIRFGIGPRGSLIFDARRDDRSLEMQQHIESGFSISSPDAVALANGVVDGTGSYEDLRSYERFVVAPGRPPRRVELAGPHASLAFQGERFRTESFSPDGAFAVIAGSASSIPGEWSAYTDYLVHRAIRFEEPSRIAQYLHQLHVVDLERGTMRQLWNAPLRIGTADDDRRIFWSPDSRQVIVGPTFQPVSGSGASGLSGEAWSLVDIATGEYWTLPVRTDAGNPIVDARWLSSTELELSQSSGEPTWLVLVDGEWRQDADGRRARNETAFRPAIRVEWRQSLNLPPMLYGVDARSGTSRLLLDPNPRLRSGFQLGRVEIVSWQAPDGRTWQGRLFYPTNYRPGRRFPLVIQTNSPAPRDSFSLYGGGPALGPGWGASFLAQPLAGSGIGVLHVDEGPTDRHGWLESGLLEQARARAAAYGAGADHLAAIGLVDREKVGLTGFSNRAWVIMYALTHTDFPYAAAIAADGKDGGYINAAVWGWPHSLSEELNGRPPFGEGLRDWLENSPALNAEQIHAPLQIQIHIGYAGLSNIAFAGWEMFSRLRRLDHPVEFYVGPNLLRGSHSLQNPRQLIGVQQRALDWWRFWLQDYEDPNPAKARQYVEWHRLRVQSQALEAQSRPPRLRWMVSPVQRQEDLTSE